MSYKNSRVKIHVGRNQKFTSKNPRTKNSHGEAGAFPWACSCGSVPVVVFPVSEQMQSKEKQTTITTAAGLVCVVCFPYRAGASLV